MHRTATIILLVILSLLATACNFPTARKTKPETPLPPPSLLVEAYPVDTIFQPFYDSLGGSDRLGPAISPLIESGNIKSQYLESALMVYDPTAAISDRYHLEALGVMQGISEPPVPDPGRPGERYVNGHVIYPDFVPFYDDIGGAHIIGRPLTEARHNPEHQRIEQYFENLGLFRFVWDSPDTVRLLAYGAYACDQRCRYQPRVNNLPSLQEATGAVRIGGRPPGTRNDRLTLSEPYRASDGKMEVVFENLVMTLEFTETDQVPTGMILRLWVPQVFYRGPIPAELPQHHLAGQLWLPMVLQINSNEPSMAIIKAVGSLWMPLVHHGLPPARREMISLRPIAELVGIVQQPPVPQRDDPLMVFYPVEGNLGYHVPLFFDAMVKQIGGVEVTGKPIMEVQSIGEGKFRQCFTNLCLIFDTRSSQGEQLTLEPIGKEYKARFYPVGESEPKSKELGDLRIEVREVPPFDFLVEGPEIQVTLSQDDQPLAGRELTLALSMPDGSRQIYALVPTNELGQTPSVTGHRGALDSLSYIKFVIPRRQTQGCAWKIII
jgi:hypothetical protein